MNSLALSARLTALQNAPPLEDADLNRHLRWLSLRADHEPVSAGLTKALLAAVVARAGECGNDE